MTEDPGGAPLQGRAIRLATADDRREAVVLATGYRGDVTLVLDDGRTLTGYVFSHDLGAADPVVRIMGAADGAKVSVPIRSLAAVQFTGDDKADGRSWRAWVARHEEKRRRAAEGVDIGDIEPQPESLD